MKISESKLRKMISEAIQQQTYETKEKQVYENFRRHLVMLWNSYWILEAFCDIDIEEYNNEINGIVTLEEIEKAKQIQNAINEVGTCEFIEELIQKTNQKIDGKETEDIVWWADRYNKKHNLNNW